MRHKILNYKIREINYETPSIFFEKIKHGSMPSFLTGEGPKDISKESVIGLNPVQNYTITNLNILWNKLRELNFSVDFHNKPFPINRLGAIGFISYEALHSIETVTKQTKDHFSFPYMNWTIYSDYYYFNEDRAFHINIKYKNQETYTTSTFEDTGFKVENLKPDFTPEQYKKNVQIVKDYITDGEVYEVNLTQGILGDFSGSPYSLFKELYKSNKAPYSAYLEREDYTIVSNSPELYLKANKDIVETRPIKGTCPRGKDLIEDKLFQEELLKSEKDQAELYMIVDLMRNDLSKVCLVGSVNVVIPKRIEQYKNVHHLVSIIQGKLDKKYDYIDLFKATFPGGSITGCPKIRCMTLTEQIEKSSRNLYTGTIFMMNQNYLNSSIVIRSAVIKDKKIILNSGGAITIDSDPTDEYLESLVKLKSLFKAVKCDSNI